jgi:CheY-like chemotaxis protein
MPWRTWSAIFWSRTAFSGWTTTREPTKDPDPRNPIFICRRQGVYREGAGSASVNGDTVVPNPRVLVAEDDRFLAALIRQTLEGHGISVTIAQNGEDALHLADRQCPDLVILDVSMPILDGFDVLRTLKADRFHRDTPVLMLTASRCERDVRCAVSNGAADFITKPFRPDLLVKRVKRLLSGVPAQAARAPKQQVEHLNC